MKASLLQLRDRVIANKAIAALVPKLFPALVRRLYTQAGLSAGSPSTDGKDDFDFRHYERSAGRAFRSREAALFHYLVIGSHRGSQPRADFSPDDYRRSNPDVAAMGYEAFAHYLRFGAAEGRPAEASEPDDAALDPPDIEVLLRRPRPRAATAKVDVVVPVYGGRGLALGTIDSALAASTGMAFELVVVDDASPDPVLSAELRRLADEGLVTLLVNERNLGFVASANRGLAFHPDRDVVLLNADTRVFDGWLDRLMAALHSTPRTATATPLSNAATILSYPVTLRNNHWPEDVDCAQLDRLCAGLGQPLVELPTGVGFCMAIRRACLDETGLFDVEHFGRGYGEENDFCLRATAAGWRHVAATNLFVWHRGGGSFGAERGARIAAVLATLERLHPGYGGMVQDFIRRDPLRPVREALDTARIRADPRPKALRLGADAELGTDGEDFLILDLVPDIGPFFGQYRVAGRGVSSSPNLRRIGRDTTPETLRRLLTDLAIRRMYLGMRPSLDPSLLRGLQAAAEAVDCDVRA